MENTNSFKIIYQETNPYGALTAFLEDDGRTVYLYLQSEQNPEWKIRALWIRNRIPAPNKREESDFSNGLAPILLSSEVTDDSDISEIKAEDVHFIWTEEGDGIAVFIKEELHAFMPSWYGIKGVSGYSKFAKVETITAYPLGDSSHGVIVDTVERSRNFWEFRSNKDSWKQIQSSRLSFLESKFGSHTKYWSADGGKFPYVGIAKFESPEYPQVVIYSTVGLSGQNMPTVELFHKDYTKFSRIELIIAVRVLPGDKSESWVPHFLGELVKFPWNMNKWLGAGHTISMNRRDPDALHLNFTSAILLKDLSPVRTSDIEVAKTPDMTGLTSESNQPINFLFIQPINDEEAYFMRAEGSKALMNLIAEKGIGWVHNSEREGLL
ncbi:MAG TPA: suppressor of fused domain protein [Leptospiraceae bacterium]|nr:suppressor of fused domain protein [Leptospiraceae bacterium]HMW04490.1 suppressor of fused domain protein [Leptospiraceae bacterium]HMX31148.1 suppressor of fused domain protein [Leptospiraceae bacterium]HMY30676.1 suppressor of fused domain protein [Leptospiraceae bacterium]HMZ63255.1 suppressor of fused domain protein [Leptospiraceae bacterium]